MTVPDDLELDRALHRAVATIPVDVDAGWRDLERRARRAPARVVVWVAAAAVVLIAVLIPIRLLAGAESSLDVTGDPGTDQPTPGTDVAPPTEPTAGPPRPIRVLLELPACAGGGDLDEWASATATTLDGAAVPDPFVATTVADVLAVAPMPTDGGASCAVTRRAGDVVAYEIRDSGGARLGRGLSVPHASPVVPPSFRLAPYFGNPIGSGQMVTGTMTRVDGNDLLTTMYSGTGIDRRLIAVELVAPATDPDLQHSGLVHLSSLTGDRLDPSMTSMPVIAGSALPARLPTGYQLCVPYAVTELDAVAGLGPGGVVYCDEDGDEIRFLTSVDDERESIGTFDGLPLPIEELAPSAPDRRTLGLGEAPIHDLIIDVPSALTDEDLLAMLRSVPSFDERVVRPAGGSNDYQDDLVSPLIDDALARAGIEATVDLSLEVSPGFASFELLGDDGEVLGLSVYPSHFPDEDPAPLLPLNEAESLQVRTVAGIDVILASQSPARESATVQLALFRCGGLNWQVNPSGEGAMTTTEPGAGATPTTAAPPPPDFEQTVIELVEGMARELPC